MKKTTIVILGLCIFLVFFYSFAPIDRVNAINQPFKRLFNNYGQLCFDLHSHTLKDRHTAEIIKTSKYDSVVYVKYRAKNSYGAYSEGQFECPIYNGTFNNEMAKWKRCQIGLIKRDDAMTEINSTFECNQTAKRLYAEKKITDNEYRCYFRRKDCQQELVEN